MPDPTPKLKLYYAPQSRAFRALWLLEELGEPYEIVQLSLDRNEQKSPEVLALNPMGKVPVVIDGGVPVCESAAIAIYLADKYPRAGLAPAIDAPERPAYLRWVVFSVGSVEPAMADKVSGRALPPRQVGWGCLDDVLTTLEAAVGPGRYLLGDRFTAADVMIGGVLGWMLQWQLVDPRPAFTGYVDHLAQRPARQRAMQIEAERAAKAA